VRANTDIRWLFRQFSARGTRRWQGVDRRLENLAEEREGEGAVAVLHDLEDAGGCEGAVGQGGGESGDCVAGLGGE
jgi:alpha/beta superfamily hydrolase